MMTNDIILIACYGIWPMLRPLSVRYPSDAQSKLKKKKTGRDRGGPNSSKGMFAECLAMGGLCLRDIQMKKRHVCGTDSL